jgi:hypothetical protein
MTDGMLEQTVIDIVLPSFLPPDHINLTCHDPTIVPITAIVMLEECTFPVH